MRITSRFLQVTYAVAFGVLLAALSSPAAAFGARGLGIGITDPDTFQHSDAGTRSSWFDRADNARAELVILTLSWRDVAPASRPPGFDPADPSDPAYSWENIDPEVRAAAARGLDVVLLVTGAPRWAEGKRRPDWAPIGSWRPNPESVRNFARAAAKRYSGSFGDLPLVRYWQLWAEPNLTKYLTPQWRDEKPFAPLHYRKMLNAFYAGVNTVRPSNLVLTGGTAPYGDPIVRREGRMQPARFWRALLCLRGRELNDARCKDPAQFDVAAHHPIQGRPFGARPQFAPRREARNRDDISTPDLHKLQRILRAAKRERNFRPVERKPLWATEVWWESDPPDDDYGVPEGKHARWLAESFYLLWKQGASRVVWAQIRDAPPDPQHGFGWTFQTGLFLRDGQSKEAFRAYRFPFVGERRSDREVRIWGKAPSAGQVEIQRRVDGAWRTFEHARAGNNRMFVETIRLRGKELLRARDGSEQSPVWKQR